jgi:hypothetical protein
MSGARGFDKKQKMHCLRRGDVWRSIDFWSWGLKQNISIQMSNFITRKEELYGNTLKDFQQAERDKTLPADFFVNVKGWFWSVKEDGYFVKLRRNDNNEWEMFTRPGTLLKPPRSFLAGLQKNEGLPNVMFGELVTSFTECDPEDRKDIGKRTVLRNKQFEKLNKIFPRGRQLECKPEHWEGVRVKIFSFPLSELSIAKAYELYSKALARSWKFHQHIGMCRYGALESTTHAIEIFKGVVQMGLEGIVIVDPSVQYGTMEDRSGDPANYFFKLKQKIVLPPTQIEQKGQIQKYKDGAIAPSEYEYALTIEDKEIKFSDQQPRKKDKFWQRLKYMEHVPGMTGFPCISGYRHMHFATPYDMSVEVPAAESLTRVSTVRHVLGVDYAIEKLNKDKMLNWDIKQEARILEASPLSTRLFNPRPFAPKSTSTDRNNSAPGASASRVPKRSSSAVFSHKPSEPTRKISRWASGVWDNPDDPYTVKHNHGAASSKAAGSKDKESTEKEQEWCELSDSDNDDNDPQPLKQQANEHADKQKNEQENEQENPREFYVSSDSEEPDETYPLDPNGPNAPEFLQRSFRKMVRWSRRRQKEKQEAEEAAREAAKKKAAEEAARKEAIEEAAYQAFLKKAKEEAENDY